MKIDLGENFLWAIFWICLFTYFSFDSYFDYQKEIQKTQQKTISQQINDSHIKELANSVIIK